MTTGKARTARKVILTGTYNSSNKGDAAMQLAMAAALAERFGDQVETSIFSPFPEMDAPFYVPVPVLLDDRRTAKGASIGIIAGSIKQQFASADLVIDLSGDMLTEDYGALVCWSHFVPLMRAMAAGTPYMLCAQSIGPFKKLHPLARFLIARAAGVTVRDGISFDYLASMGLPDGKVRQSADMAFLLPAIGADEAHGLIRQSGLDPALPIVAVSLSRLVAKRYDRRHAEGSFTAMIAQQLRQLAAEQQVQILFVAHVTGPTPDKDDRVISREVLGLLGDGPFALFDRDARPEELKGVLSQCSATIGCRMHANIGSLSSNVPVLAIAYSHKTPGIMRACGVEEMVLDVDHFSPDDFCKKARELLERRQKLGDVLRQSVAKQKALAETNLNLVGKILGLTSPAGAKGQDI